jgi:hypothetical protein
MLRRRYNKILAALPPCQVLCNCRDQLNAEGFIGTGICVHGNTVYCSPPMLSIEAWNALAAATLAQCHGDIMPADSEAQRLNDLRRAPYSKSAEQLARENQAAKDYYDQVPRSLKHRLEGTYGGNWGT